MNNHRTPIVDDTRSIADDFCKILSRSESASGHDLAAMEHSLFGSPTQPVYDLDLPNYSKPFDATAVKQMALTLTRKWNLEAAVRAQMQTLENDVRLRAHEQGFTFTVRFTTAMPR